jgi:UDP-N-acetylglucosamine 2-epimerase (non-hydrolysing)
MTKIMFVLGTRPEAIKLAPVILQLKESRYFDVSVCATGQHKEMLDQVLGMFSIHPNYSLEIMKKNQSLSRLHSRILYSFDEVIKTDKPDWVVVHGDTATSFSASLCSFHNRINIAHVEAGLRTGDLQSPWPEEAYRQMTARLATWNFAPTETSRANLLREGISDNRISVTGNTVIDALFYVSRELDTNVELIKEMSQNYNFLDRKKFLILVTGHRRENFGSGFQEICDAIIEISKDQNTQIVYPVHLNPNVRDVVHKRLKNINNVHLIDPVDYKNFVYLMKQSHIILTDSGGVQEEAPSLGKPVLVMRNNTERPEAVAAGTVKLVGVDKTDIVNAVLQLVYNPNIYSKMSHAINPYGDGRASLRILKFFEQHAI